MEARKAASSSPKKFEGRLSKNSRITLSAQDVQYARPHQRLIGGETRDEVLHVEPSADANTSQTNWLAVCPDNSGPPGVHELSGRAHEALLTVRGGGAVLSRTTNVVANSTLRSSLLPSSQ